MVLVSGTEAHAEGLKVEVAAVLVPMGLRLSEEKTTIVHIDEGFDFLGFRIQRQRKPGTRTSGSSTPGHRRSRFASIMAKVKAITDRARATHSPTSCPVESGAAGLDHLLPIRRVEGDLQVPEPLHVVQGHRMAPPEGAPCHQEAAATSLSRHGWRPQQDGVILFHAAAVPVTRYRYRGARIPTPWDEMMRSMVEGSSA